MKQETLLTQMEGLVNYMTTETIIASLKGETKREVIDELLTLGMQAYRVDMSLKDDLLEAVMYREAKGTTGIQKGIAVPHAKTDLVSELIFVMGRHVKGVDFGAVDKQLSQMIILTVSPLNQTLVYLEVLSMLCKKLKDDALYERLLRADNAHDMLRCLTH